MYLVNAIWSSSQNIAVRNVANTPGAAPASTRSWAGHQWLDCRLQPACVGAPAEHVGEKSMVILVIEASVSGRFQPASAGVVANGSVSIYQKGVGGYTMNSRWGDCPATAADPNSPGTAWFPGEYARSTTSRGTATSIVTP